MLSWDEEGTRVASMLIFGVEVVDEVVATILAVVLFWLVVRERGSEMFFVFVIDELYVGESG